MVNLRTIDEVLGSLSLGEKEKVQSLRALIKSTVPQTVEFVRQGKITYRLEEKDFVWIRVFGGHVDLEFFMGASLSSGLLKSRGDAELSDKVRHVEVGDFEKVQPELARLLKQAATVGFEHCQK